MGFWCIGCFVFGLAFGEVQAFGGVQDDVRSSLQDLASSQSALRTQAQGYLGVHLNLADAPLVFQAALADDLEGRWALAEVLSAHPRLLDLAAQASIHPEAAVREVGEWALERSALRWNPALADGVRRGSLPEEWTENPGPMGQLETDPSQPAPGGLATALLRLQRYGDLPVALVLDPGLDPQRSLQRDPMARAPEVLEGGWPRLLARLVRAHRASWELWGWRPEPLTLETAVRPRPFLRIRQAGNVQDVRGAELLAGWIRNAAQASDPNLARASATALAQAGWPAAIGWLEARCLAGRIEFWPALCVAADGDRVVRALTSRQGITALLGALDQTGAPGSVLARDGWSLAGRALVHAPSFLEDGSPLADTLLATGSGPGLSTLRLWLAFAAYAQRGELHPGLAAEAWRVVQDPKSDPALRRAALLALDSMGVDPKPGPLVGGADWISGLSPVAREGVIASAEALGLTPPNGAGAAFARSPELVRLALWQATTGDRAAATNSLLQAATGPALWNEPVAVLRAALATGREGLLRDLLQRLESSPAASLASKRWALALGLMELPQARARLEALLGKLQLDRDEWLEVAYLIQWGPLEDRVRGSLIRALEQEVPSEALEPALEVAMRCLRAQRLPVKAEDFDGDLRRVATRSAHPLARTLLDWGSTLTRPPEPQEPMGSSELVLPQ